MLYVCNLNEMPQHVGTLRPTHLMSLITPEEQPPTPHGITLERHLRIDIHDISEPLEGCILPDRPHVEDVIGFIRDWRPDEGALMIHCFAGISRSMASALIALVVKAGGREHDAAQHLRQLAPHAHPNSRIIALADQLLHCEGRLIAAREAMGPNQLTYSGPLTRVPLLG